MKIVGTNLDSTFLSKWLMDNCNWIALRSDDRIRPTAASITYIGEYNDDAGTASYLADLILNKFTNTVITSGTLRIHGLWPSEKPQIQILQRLLESPDREGGIFKPIVLFQDEYVNLLSAIAWCLATGWSFDFIALPQRFLMQAKAHDNEVSVTWDQTQEMLPNVERLLSAHDFVVGDEGVV